MRVLAKKFKEIKESWSSNQSFINPRGLWGFGMVVGNVAESDRCVFEALECDLSIMVDSFVRRRGIFRCCVVRL
ncbi:hypothetical protein Scep_001569 [Stephania cephalantha]|uniref:Uncharacterized protein n=1 Tax=Stephania cephalantha TaxID=152367 RepID=A0AAP0L8A3_9MAGN